VSTPPRSESPSLPKLLCIPHVLTHQAEHNPDATAILAPGRPPLTYGCLHRHIIDVGRTLRAMGIRRNDRVALALTKSEPNGDT
jgi:acyl-CoA synthetase (AMP-forming)/AMP-acid ligase II